MKRTMAAGAVVGALMALGMPGAALAGGGCHGAATHQDATDMDEATVRMVDACFDASITMVDPGTDVTFVNEDVGGELTHNVGGTGWGSYDDMHVGDTYTATFHEAGIYPFACSYHLGMTGAIVVGDGKGAGNGLAVSTTPPTLDPVDAVPAASSGVAAPWVATAAIAGLAVGAGAVFAAVRTRKPARAA